MADATNNNDASSAAWQKLRREQILFIARNTTPLQRVEAVEQMILALRDYLPSRKGFDPRFKPDR